MLRLVRRSSLSTSCARSRGSPLPPIVIRWVTRKAPDRTTRWAVLRFRGRWVEGRHSRRRVRSFTRSASVAQRESMGHAPGTRSDNALGGSAVRGRWLILARRPRVRSFTRIMSAAHRASSGHARAPAPTGCWAVLRFRGRGLRLVRRPSLSTLSAFTRSTSASTLGAPRWPEASAWEAGRPQRAARGRPPCLVASRAGHPI